MSPSALVKEPPEERAPVAESTVNDAELIRIDVAAGIVVFDSSGRQYSVAADRSVWWAAGTIGRLWLGSQGTYGFQSYPDQRLRRCPQADDPRQRRWGWRIGEHRFAVKVGVVPGKSGAVVHEDTETQQIALPREMIDFCRRRGFDSADVLRGFMADLCEFHNWASCPREDGLGTNGKDQQFLAREYFERTYPVFAGPGPADSAEATPVP